MMRGLVLSVWLVACGSETSLSGKPDDAGAGGPELRVRPPRLDFGALPLGTEATLSFEVSNAGTEALTVSAVTVDQIGFDLDLPPLPLDLVPGGSFEVPVTYRPDEGVEAALALVQADAGEATVELSGRLALPELIWEPEVLEVGELGLYCEERATLSLRSVGEAPATVQELLLLGEGLSLASLPELPLWLPPGSSVPVEVVILRGEPGPWSGQLLARSDTPRGEDVVDFSGLTVEEGACAEPEGVTLSFEVRYDRADVAFVVDTSSSMAAAVDALTSEFSAIASSVSTTLSDVTFGVATYDDYGFPSYPLDRPFRLAQQQTDDLSRVNTALRSITLAVGGSDWEEAGNEVLVQAALGQGYDQNCNRSYDPSSDVRPFVSSPADAYLGLVPGTYDPTVPGTGALGGMGFREDVLPILVHTTDAAFKEPGSGALTPGGCPGDAGLADAIAALQAVNGKYIGVQIIDWGESPGSDMRAVANATGSLGDLDGDGVVEPTVTTWDGDSADFRRQVVAAIEALATGATFDTVELEVVRDPDGVLLDIDPDSYSGIISGTNVDFTLLVDGTLYTTKTPGASELELRLVADDTITLLQRTFWVVR